MSEIHIYVPKQMSVNFFSHFQMTFLMPMCNTKMFLKL